MIGDRIPSGTYNLKGTEHWRTNCLVCPNSQSERASNYARYNTPARLGNYGFSGSDAIGIRPSRRSMRGNVTHQPTWAMTSLTIDHPNNEYLHSNANIDIISGNKKASGETLACRAAHVHVGGETMSDMILPQLPPDEQSQDDWISTQWLGHTIRAVFENGEWWFHAADVCAALGIDRSQVRRLDDDEKGVHSIHTPGGDQPVTVINEAGLYTLTLSSRKPEAKQFKRWIVHEMIPQLRAHGFYLAHGITPDQIDELKEYVTAIETRNAYLEASEDLLLLQNENLHDQLTARDILIGEMDRDRRIERKRDHEVTEVEWEADYITKGND